MLEFILRSVGEGIPGTLFCHDLNQRIRFFNDAFASQYLRLTGRVPQLGEPTVDFLPDPELRAEIEKYRRRAAAGEPVTAEYTVHFGEAVEIWEIHCRPVRDDQGQVIGILAWGQDVTARKQEREFLQRLEVILAQMQDAVLVTEAWPIDAAEGGPRILYVNEAFERMTGYTRAEVIGQTPRILQGPRTRREELDRLRAALEQWQPVRVELVNYRKDGREFLVDISLSPVRDPTGKVVCWVAIQRDVTREKAMVAILQDAQDALEERQVLLQEVHHRVKNNFQTIISLLELQAVHLEQPGFDRLLHDMASRIRAMALIHEQLYQQSDFSHVLLDELCASLAAHMQQVFPAASVRVEVRPGQVALPLNVAVPVALIVHELLLNAFKHGIPAGAHHIAVQFRRTADAVTIEVIDDGRYHPPDLPAQLENSRHFGVRIVRLLARQLHGRVDFMPEPGRFCAALTFPLGPDEGGEPNHH
ncbi:PAS domain-containing protein [Chloracidobacterium sp. D]|uniref:sensor histidine kinase n=1 Tax=Chloracidobacterium sp. D TaxID=2821536 RepID=UPI001B8B98F3|nr:PAS domain-containing protein [Chloracidobacterium sp. D]QUV81356.1 PAS domain-containing protein [Chloracidobacterium sp. D]